MPVFAVGVTVVPRRLDTHATRTYRFSITTIFDMEADVSSETSTAPHRADRVTIVVILVIGALAGALLAATGLISAISRIASPDAQTVRLLADIPVEAGPGIVSAHGDSLVVVVDRLDAGALWLIAAGEAFGALMIAAVTLSFGYLLWQVAQGRPFPRAAQTAVLVTGCAITFGSLLSQGLGGLGQMMAAGELQEATGGLALVQFELAPLPLLIGFGIMALAYAFRAGHRLQHDTEGLV